MATTHSFPLKQGVIGMKLATGEVVRTTSGRLTTPFPKFTSANGKKALTCNVDYWLLHNAWAEATARGDQFNALQFGSIKQNTIQQADKDSAEEYLFGQQPTVVPSILKTMRVAS